MSWEREDVIRFLDDYPLPKDFVWGGMVVQPRYHVTGYGKWLFESGPYYPALRGLPQLIAEILPEFVEKERRLPLPEELAALLTIAETKLGPLFRLNMAVPDITDGYPAIPKQNPEITQTEPRDNPAGAQQFPTSLPNGCPDHSQP